MLELAARTRTCPSLTAATARQHLGQLHQEAADSAGESPQATTLLPRSAEQPRRHTRMYVRTRMYIPLHAQMGEMTPRKQRRECLSFALPAASAALPLQKTSPQPTVCSFLSVFPSGSTVPQDSAPLSRHYIDFLPSFVSHQGDFPLRLKTPEPRG